MNIITIIKRENNKMLISNIIPIFTFIILVIFAIIVLWLFNNLVSISMITQKINYETIITFSKSSTYSVFIVSLIICPILTAGSLNKEKENGSLDVILTTFITRDDILIAKIIHKLFCIGILCVAIFPFIMLTQMFMGFAFVTTINTMFALLFTTLLILTIGMCFSSYIEDTFTGMILHYVVTAIIALWLYYQKDIIYMNDNITWTIYIAEIFLTMIFYTLTKHGKVFNK